MTTAIGPDGQARCAWAAASLELLAYHDTEWGFPVVDDRRLFEKVSLEGFQCGLSWRTILAKRENFRHAFVGFDFTLLAEFTESDVERLLSDSGIVRHRGKIAAVLNNAHRALELVEECGSLARYFWNYEPTDPAIHAPQTVSVTRDSMALSKDLKKRGWKFVGPTTVFAFMQAMGLVNDHATQCVTRSLVGAERDSFTPPG